MFSTVLCLVFMLLCIKAAFVYGDHMYKKGHKDGAVFGHDMAQEEGFNVGFDAGRFIGHREGHECAQRAGSQTILLLTDEEQDEDSSQDGPHDANSVH